MSVRCCRHTYCQIYTSDPTGYCAAHVKLARAKFRGLTLRLSQGTGVCFEPVGFIPADIAWLRVFDPELAKMMQDANDACAKVRDYCESKLESTAQLRADRIEQEGR